MISKRREKGVSLGRMSLMCSEWREGYFEGWVREGRRRRTLGGCL